MTEAQITNKNNQLIIKHLNLYEIFKKWYITLKEYQDKKVKISNVII